MTTKKEAPLDVVRSRIDRETKRKAMAALEEMGMTTSEAIRLLMVRIGEEKRLPFPVEVPNYRTRQAMAELETGNGTRASSAEDAFRQLGITE
ncbi:MAG: type II toxin-antitoxin system RelB/DinJ family antitoxin [Guyparkeria sp.]